MSDDCSAQIGAIKEIFPESKVLLCLFHVVQALWRWLQSNETKNDRQNIFYLFIKLIYSKNYLENKSFLIEQIQNNPKLVNHFNKIFKKEQLFACIFRKNLTLFGVNTNNLVERSFLNIKQKFLERNKVYNVIQLIQQVTLKYEKNINIKLIDYLRDRKQYIYKTFKNINRENLKGICKFILDSKFSLNTLDSLNKTYINPLDGSSILDGTSSNTFVSGTNQAPPDADFIPD